MRPDICLGTAQFGLAYGITNAAGQVAEREVSLIFEQAALEGIQFLDTAQAYGNAEAVVGRCWPATAPRRIVSKLPSLSEVSCELDWETTFQASLQRLQVPQLDGFLLHRPADLIGSQGDRLLSWLEGLRARDLVSRIGVSIYQSSDLEGLPLERLQLVQLPLSIYDQRLISDGTVATLAERGIAVHVRSVFLQGLLPTPVEHWPAFLSTGFRQHHRQLTMELAAMGLSLLDGALGFARACDGFEAIVLGVQSSVELGELLAAWRQSPALDGLFDPRWAWQNEQDLDPRCWPTR